MRKKLLLSAILILAFVGSASAQTATFSNFQPADGSTYTQGQTINISVDATVSNGGTSVDIEGIFDGSIDTVFSHPGDGSTQSYTFQVKPSAGTYNYRFSAITSSPNGDFINDTESRTLNVESSSFEFQDNFEDGDTAEWTILNGGGSAMSVTNDAIKGTYSGYQQYDGTNAQAIRDYGQNYKPENLQAYFAVDSIVDDTFKFGFNEKDDTARPVQFQLTSSGDIQIYDNSQSSFVTISSYQANTVYRLEFRNIDYQNDTIGEVYLNGTLEDQDVAIEDAAGVGEMRAESYSTGEWNIKLDNLGAYSPTEITVNSFSPPEGTSIVEGETQTIEANITVENGGTPVDIEGIFDGNIDTVFSHPGDGTSKVVSFTVTPSSAGQYNYWFNVITSSPNGDSLGSTEVRDLTVEQFNATATFSNFSPADNTTVYTGNSQDISVDVTADNNGNQIDIEAIYNGSIDEVFTHPGDGSTQSYTFTVTPSTEGTPDYRFSAITSSPDGEFINDTESRNLYVTDYPASANFSNFQPPDGSNITEGESQTISIDISVDNNGNPVDIEGIFDGTIESVSSHPGDGTTQSYSFSVSPSSAGNYSYRFSVITDSPSGTFIDDSESRTLEVLSSTDGGGDGDGGTGDNIGGMIGGTLAEILSGIIDGFFSGVESEVSESNQAFLAIIVSVILGMIAGGFTGHGSFGVGTTVLGVLGFTIKGWLPSWVGFVFVVLTAGLVAWIGSKAGGG